MKILRAILLFLTLPATAANVYYAASATGSGTGADASNCKALSSQNASWTTSAGDTMHIVGTIPYALNIGGSGSAGSPITIYFESAAKFSAQYWTNSGAINITTKNYITIDGGLNGIIESTANGTGLAHQSDDRGINAINCRYLTVQNLAVNNIYQRTDLTEQNDYGVAILDYSSAGVVSDFTVSNCVIHDAYIGIDGVYDAGCSNYTWIANTITRVNWGAVSGDVSSSASLRNVVFARNTVNTFSNWDDTVSNNYHHNGYYGWAMIGGQLNDVYCYGNKIGPRWGVHATGGLFFSGSTTNVNLYNNLFFDGPGNDAPSNGSISYGGSGPLNGKVLIANNTFYGPGSANGGSALNLQATYNPNVCVTNNLCVGIGNYFAIFYASTMILRADYNWAYDIKSDQGYCYSSDGSGNFLTWSQWQTDGYDPHGSYGTNPLMNSDGTLATNSPAIGAGANLTSLGLPGFTTDITGKARPSTGGWTPGAFEGGTNIPVSYTLSVTNGSGGGSFYSGTTNTIIGNTSIGYWTPSGGISNTNSQTTTIVMPSSNWSVTWVDTTRTYYVDYSAGSDSSAGTATGTAWKHCPGDSAATGTAASATLSAGDTVIFKSGVQYIRTGTYDTGIAVNWSGTPASPITYKSDGSWGTGKAIFTDTNSPTGHEVFLGTTCSNLVFTNLICQNLGGSPTLPADTGSYVLPNRGVGISFSANATRIKIVSCDFSNLGYAYNTQPMDSQHSIDGGGVGFVNPNFCTIDNCTFSHMSTAIYLGNVNSQSNSIINCDFSHNIRWCIDLNMYAPSDYYDHYMISNNNFHDYYEFDAGAWTGYGEWPHTDGIFCRCDFTNCAYGTNNNICNNKFYASNSTGGGTADIYITEGPSWNVFNNQSIFSSKGRGFYLNNTSLPNNPQVVNIYNNSFVFSYTVMVYIQSTGNTYGNSIISVKNNAFYDTITGSGANYAVYLDTTDPMLGFSLDYDCYKTFNFVNAVFSWPAGGAVDQSVTNLHSIGYELHGLQTDPLYTSISSEANALTVNLFPKTNSPLIAAGIALPLVATDFNGTNRPNPPTIGAFEYSTNGGGGTTITNRITGTFRMPPGSGIYTR